jgi:transposase
MKSKRVTRRQHGSELKALVLRECERAGASVAAVAMAHGLNANLVHKWRRDARCARTASLPVAAEFLALPMPAAAPPASPPADIRIELRRGATAVNIAWPVCAAAECGAWMRELLK